MAVDLNMVSPQTSAIYRQIANCPDITAHDIANSLAIYPNAVYRAAKDLIDLGLVETTDTYPVRYKPSPAQKALSLYLQASAKNFRNQFGVGATNSNPINETFSISLVKDRESLLKSQNADVLVAKFSIDFIVSGLEVPDETVLAFRKAAAVGVKIRAIVQQKRETSKDQLEKWHDLGATVKYLPDLKIRLIVIDQKITYLTSYDPSHKNSAFGVRLNYEPFAVQMSELFNLNWQKAVRL